MGLWEESLEVNREAKKIMASYRLSWRILKWVDDYSVETGRTKTDIIEKALCSYADETHEIQEV